jgi:hypothetical protein
MTDEVVLEATTNTWDVYATIIPSRTGTNETIQPRSAPSKNRTGGASNLA